MTTLAELERTVVSAMLEELGADGWLLFDFHGCNPIAKRILPVSMGTRRLFVWVPRSGPITAIVHRIELQPFLGFDGITLPYAAHAELHEALRAALAGKVAAMEVSPRDAVPYLDRIPWGVIDLLESLGTRIVSSGGLVTRFAATWTAGDYADHVKAAELLRTIAIDALHRAVTRGGTGYTESAMQREVIDAIAGAGLVINEPPIVGFGSNAALPHYEPRSGNDRTLAANEVVLLDLFAGVRSGAVFADQTWMGFSGRVVPPRVAEVWETVRSARDAAIAAIKAEAAAGRAVPGFLGDRVARGVITRAGYGEYFVHRTGHSIDHDLHGSGPHLDDYETHDDRLMQPGTGCSVEPGIYLPGDFGVRSEVNLYWGREGFEVTPQVPQSALVTVA